MRSLFASNKPACSCGGLRIIGDVHGEHLQLTALAKHHHAIQIGDVGFGFNRDLDKALDDAFERRPELRFIRGNHDKPSKCKSHPRHIASGMDPSGIFFVGGGYSIDKDARVPGVSWWEDEQHSYEEFEKLIDEYRLAKPHMVISHEGPKVATHKMFEPQWEITSRTAQALGIMWKIHQPKLWVFGHWHKNKEVVVGATRFICAGENQARDLHYPTCSRFKEITP